MLRLFRATKLACGPMCRDVHAEVESINREAAIRELVERRNASERDQENNKVGDNGFEPLTSW